MVSVAGIHHLALTVRNLDVSVDWYTATLGFEEIFREDGPGRKACVMRIPGSTSGVGLVEHGASADDRFDPQRLGLDHAAFTVSSRQELDRWAAELTTAGIDHSGVIDVPPGAILNFKDPDGIALALFWDRVATP